jgi:hypothetical protein
VTDVQGVVFALLAVLSVLVAVVGAVAASRVFAQRRSRPGRLPPPGAATAAAAPPRRSDPPPGAATAGAWPWGAPPAAPPSGPPAGAPPAARTGAPPPPPGAAPPPGAGPRRWAFGASAALLATLATALVATAGLSLRGSGDMTTDPPPVRTETETAAATEGATPGPAATATDAPVPALLLGLGERLELANGYAVEAQDIQIDAVTLAITPPRGRPESRTLALSDAVAAGDLAVRLVRVTADERGARVSLEVSPAG